MTFNSNTTSYCFGVQKSGQWCAAHVRTAWAIHVRQQYEKQLRQQSTAARSTTSSFASYSSAASAGGLTTSSDAPEFTAGISTRTEMTSADRKRQFDSRANSSSSSFERHGSRSPPGGNGLSEPSSYLTRRCAHNQETASVTFSVNFC